MATWTNCSARWLPSTRPTCWPNWPSRAERDHARRSAGFRAAADRPARCPAVAAIRHRLLSMPTCWRVRKCRSSGQRLASSFVAWVERPPPANRWPICSVKQSFAGGFSGVARRADPPRNRSADRTGAGKTGRACGGRRCRSRHRLRASSPFRWRWNARSPPYRPSICRPVRWLSPATNAGAWARNRFPRGDWFQHRWPGGASTSSFPIRPMSPPGDPHLEPERPAVRTALALTDQARRQWLASIRRIVADAAATPVNPVAGCFLRASATIRARRAGTYWPPPGSKTFTHPDLAGIPVSQALICNLEIACPTFSNASAKP